MSCFSRVFNKIFGKTQTNNKRSHNSDEEINDENSVISDTIFDSGDSVNMKDYLKEIKAIYTNILDYLENKQDDDEVQNEDYNLSDQEIFQNKYIFKLVINLLSKIANNHTGNAKQTQRVC